MSEEQNNTVETANKLEGIQGKFLTFKLVNEEYGLEILRVKEIIGIMTVTTLPQTPPFVKGVINLRGKVIPVIDLRLKFGLPEKEYDEKTCIIVVEVNCSNFDTQMGIIVDAVSEVLNVAIDDLEPKPNFGLSLNTDFILGMSKGKDNVRTLLDINKVLSSDDISSLLGNL